MPYSTTLAISWPTSARRTAHFLLGAGALALAPLAPLRANAQSGSITDLGGGTIRVTAFNNNDQVILQNGVTSYVWKDGVTTPVISDQYYPGSFVYSINASGMMGGAVSVSDNPFNDAATWSSPSALTEVVDPLHPHTDGDIRAYNSAIVAINNAGIAVANGSGPFIVSGGVIQHHLDVASIGFNQAIAMNNVGQVAGTAYIEPPAGYYAVATVWSAAGHVQYLDPDPSAHESGAVSINDHGQFVGYDYGRATLWQPDGTLQFLTPEGFDAKALGINNRGQVLVSSSQGDFIWENGIATQLSALLPSSSTFSGLSGLKINDRGQVIGYGHVPGDSVLHAFFLTPPAQPGLIRDSTFASGTLVGWTPSGPGTAQAVAISHGSGFAAQLTTGSPVDLSQYIDLPSGPSYLNFSYEFETPTGTLDVMLGGTLLESLTAPPGGGFIDGSVAIPAGLLGTSSDLLDFHFDGPHGSQVLIDSVAVSDSPEPASSTVLALAAFGLLSRRRKP